MKINFQNKINFNKRYKYLIKGSPQNLTKAKDRISLHGPGEIRKNHFLLTITDDSMFKQFEVKQMIKAFKANCKELGVKYFRSPF